MRPVFIETSSSHTTTVQMVCEWSGAIRHTFLLCHWCTNKPSFHILYDQHQSLLEPWTALFLKKRQETSMQWRQAVYVILPANEALLGLIPDNLFDVPKSDILMTPLYVLTRTLSPAHTNKVVGCFYTSSDQLHPPFMSLWTIFWLCCSHTMSSVSSTDTVTRSRMWWAYQILQPFHDLSGIVAYALLLILQRTPVFLEQRSHASYRQALEKHNAMRSMECCLLQYFH